MFLIDLRYALRRLRNQPGFAIVACLSLAIGIGSATAGFGVLYAVMVRDLPVRDPERLAVVSMQNTGFQYSMSYPGYVHLRDRSTALDGLIAFRAQTLNVKAGPATERIVREAGVLIAIGIAIGAPSAFALGRTLQGLLFGVQPADAATAASRDWRAERRRFCVCLDPRTPGRQGRSTGRAAVGIGRTPAALAFKRRSPL